MRNTIEITTPCDMISGALPPYSLRSVIGSSLGRPNSRSCWGAGNTGTLPWPPGTVLALRDGDPMEGPAGISLPEAPLGSTVRLVLRLRAPSSGRAYGVWSLADADRVPFGVLFWVDAQVVEVPAAEAGEEGRL